ncbi:AraC family transcriptional regulator [Gracilibacillus halophilus YIM-C55.5]|uniref:AraC family transcriptional regulator n=1 Tax=Gracilibacillus halophilus YIM-C55.5 TaxID=1308866 RepID=N4WTE1_9BACI|nr:helix-turn-helix domain-containing protein [Gracilibacillus halophilus]ENH96426.1 AraC family transcriptional regulator [Gracilibacillus halophilus YIM-C55.5]
MRINFCGYSYHNQSFFTSHQSRYSSYLFRLQTDGIAKVNINGNTAIVEKGDLLIIKPEEKYELYTEDGANSGDFHLYCEGDWIHQRFDQAPSLTKIDLDETLMDLWHHLIIEERRPLKEYSHELSYYLLYALCISLDRQINGETTVIHRPYTVTKMMRYIEEHATRQGFRVQEVADQCHLSISRAVHLFKEHVGMTIMDYAQQIRIATAKNQMKYTTMTLDNIAQNSGFGSYSYLHRVFKKHTGISPGKYRNKI